MIETLNSICSKESAKKYEEIYIREVNEYGRANQETKFNYAWSLIDVGREANVKLGLRLLEDMYRNTNVEAHKRDYLYYLAIGNTKIKNYTIALKFIDAVLKIEPTNSQVITLKEHVKTKLQNEGLAGIAIAGTGAILLGGIIALAVKAIKR